MVCEQRDSTIRPFPQSSDISLFFKTQAEPTVSGHFRTGTASPHQAWCGDFESSLRSPCRRSVPNNVGLHNIIRNVSAYCAGLDVLCDTFWMNFQIILEQLPSTMKSEKNKGVGVVSGCGYLLNKRTADYIVVTCIQLFICFKIRLFLF